MPWLLLGFCLFVFGMLLVDLGGIRRAWGWVAFGIAIFGFGIVRMLKRLNSPW